MKKSLRGQPLPVLSGMLWTTDASYRETTDASYRETRDQLDNYARSGVLAVEMQAASLFAFSAALRFPVGIVAHVTNSVDLGNSAFEKGAREVELEILRRICLTGKRFVSASHSSSST